MSYQCISGVLAPYFKDKLQKKYINTVFSILNFLRGNCFMRYFPINIKASYLDFPKLLVLFEKPLNLFLFPVQHLFQ